MTELNNILLVAGSGRNVGKTSFIESIIQSVSEHMDVIAIKISPHFHQLTESVKTLWQSDDLFIGEETSSTSSKDTSRFLRAGASKVIYVQALDYALNDFLKWLVAEFPYNTPIICESGGLGNYIKAGVFMQIKDQESEKQTFFIEQPNVVPSNNGEWEFDISNITWNQSKWELKS